MFNFVDKFDDVDIVTVVGVTVDFVAAAAVVVVYVVVFSVVAAAVGGTVSH